MHDRTVQLAKIKERIHTLVQKLDGAIVKTLKGEKLDLFNIILRHEDISNHPGNAALKLEWVFPNVVVQQLRVSPHQFIREVAYALAVAGDELLIVRYTRNSNPGKLSNPELVARTPLNDDIELTMAIQDFKTWMVTSMDQLRIQILPTPAAAIAT